MTEDKGTADIGKMNKFKWKSEKSLINCRAKCLRIPVKGKIPPTHKRWDKAKPILVGNSELL